MTEPASPWGDQTWHGGRVWTPAEATAALPLVRRIADDLVGAYRRWQQAVEAFEYAVAGSSAVAPNPEAERLMSDTEKLAEEVEGFRRELARLDVRVAHPAHGLIAFRSERNGRVVPLYWWRGAVAPSYDWPDALPGNGTSISWPSRAQPVAENRSRA
jgi:hypothetical protein